MRASDQLATTADGSRNPQHQGTAQGEALSRDRNGSRRALPRLESRPGRPCRDYDVISVTVRWYVGRIFTEQMAQGERWRWSITSEFMEGSSGYTGSLEDAKREFAAAWRAWLAKTGRDQETFRPLYGTPVGE